MMSNWPDTVEGMLESLRAKWRGRSFAADLDAQIAASGDAELSKSQSALKAIRSAASWLSRNHCHDTEKLSLLRAALDCYTGRPFKTWLEIRWALDIAVECPDESVDLLATLIVSVRLGVKGDAPALADLGLWGDDTHALLPSIGADLAELFSRRDEIGLVMYRQLVKSLPHVGAEQDELQHVRSAIEYIQWLVDCPLTLHIREEIHSKASPGNLTLVQAYLAYLETGDAAGLAGLFIAQKIPAHDRLLAQAGDPESVKRTLITTARELEGLLKRIYAFDPGDATSVFKDVELWLAACQLDDSADIRANIEAIGTAWSGADSSGAIESLTAGRLGLEELIPHRPASEALCLLYLDLELEKLGYLMFGQVVHDELAEITDANLPRVVAALRAMVLNASIKGQGTAKLRWLSGMLSDMSPDRLIMTSQLLVLNHHINDEIAAVSLGLYRQYSRIVSRVFTQISAQNVDIQVSKFVDGLIRDTTLQHLGELSMRVHHFALARLEHAGGGEADSVRLQVDSFDRKVGSESIGMLTEDSDQAPPEMWVYRFSRGEISHSEDRPEILGGKGAALCGMSRMGLSVPPGFVVGVSACREYMAAHALQPPARRDIRDAMLWLQDVTGKTFGSSDNPLLAAVRSGALTSMPGMLDTVLNVGMTDDVAGALGEIHRSERVAAELYIRFLIGYAKSLFSLADVDQFETQGPSWDTIERIKTHVTDAGGPAFWRSVDSQIVSAVEAVFRSWRNPHAVLFRRTHHMPHGGCTAATVQQMVFGNADDNSCTGVMFTRNPSTGDREIFGEYLPRAQGEDLVAGRRTPLSILSGLDSLAQRMPEILAELRRTADLLEEHYGCMQDIEFTVESGRLYILQTRQGHLAANGAGSPDTGADAPGREFAVIARGLGASPGAVLGRIALTGDGVRELAERGCKTILVRTTTIPEDLPHMIAADAVLTQTGGATSHAANNARHLGKPCVVGCQAMRIDAENGEVRFGDVVMHAGDRLFIDGMSGEVGLPE